MDGGTMIDLTGGFYRTYEELKHSTFACLGYLLPSFYRTYEELKPEALDELNGLRGLLVFIVPMRN